MFPPSKEAFTFRMHCAFPYGAGSVSLRSSFHVSMRHADHSLPATSEIGTCSHEWQTLCHKPGWRSPKSSFPHVLLFTNVSRAGGSTSSILPPPAPNSVPTANGSSCLTHLALPLPLPSLLLSSVASMVTSLQAEAVRLQQTLLASVQS